MRNEKPKTGYKQVGAVVNAIGILNYLNRATEPCGVAKISKDTNINRSTCFNILRTLAELQIVHFDQNSLKYELGIGLAPMAMRSLNPKLSLRMARAQMRKIARTYGISVSLWRRVGENHLILTALEESEGGLRVHLSLGQRVPLLGGAMGRLFATAAGLGRAETKRRFEAVRWQRPINFDTFMNEANEAVKRGWAIDDGHYVHGALNLAALIPGDELMVCTASMFQKQHDKATQREIGKAMAALAKDLANQPASFSA